MFYIIIPITAGDVPESWYAYLIRVGPITIYQSKPEPAEQALIVQFNCDRRVVHQFDNPLVFNKSNMSLNFSYFSFDHLHFALCDSPDSLPLNRLNTDVFFHNAWRLKFNYQDQTVRLAKRNYFLLCSGLFKSPPVSICRNPQNREIIYYNEKSKVLDECFRALCGSGLRNNINEITNNLLCLSRFVKKSVLLSKDIKDLSTIVGDQRNTIMAVEGATPNRVTVVNLKRFIEAKMGLCRHHAMLVCYLLQRMKMSNILPEGEIIHFRMVLKSKHRPNYSVGHSFVLYRRPDHQEIYVVDSSIARVYRLPSMREKFISHFNDEIYQRLANDYIAEAIYEPTLPLYSQSF
jgi:hypothetical protein